MSKYSNKTESRYDIHRRKEFLLLKKTDEQNLESMKPLAENNLQELLEPLYDHILDYPETRNFFKNDEHVERIKKGQGRFFLELMGGTYDEEYMSSRLTIGRIHERVGLEPQWYMGAYSRYLSLLIPLVSEFCEAKELDFQEYLQSIIKVIFLDMGFAIDTYIDSMFGKVEEEKIRLGERFQEALEQYSDQLMSSTEDIATTITQQGDAVHKQATSIAQVTATMRELRETSQQALENANEVIEAADGSVRIAKSGKDAVEESILGMNNIQTQVELIAEKILILSEQTQQIGEIIESVNEISEQSKLLALNAAIEAARAGEHGRGFSVVASEIRNLADQSKQATRQVRALLGEIQKATNGAVIATEEGNKSVARGVELVNRAGENIQSLSEAIRYSADVGKLINISSQQQMIGVEQVTNAMIDINEAANNTSSSLKKTQEVSQALLSLSEDMTRLFYSFDEQS
jgi:methyl-accepting chemotaxis protein